MDINAILDDTDFFLDDMILDHETRLLKAIRNLEKRIIDEAAKLPGLSASKQMELKQAQVFHQTMINLFAEEFDTEVVSIMADFEDVDAQLKKELAYLEIADGFTEADETMFSALKAQAADDFTEMSTRTRNQLAQALYDTVAGGGTFAELTGKFSAALTGEKDKHGNTMAAYAKTLAQDHIMGYSAKVNRKKAVDAGMKHFLYYGDIIKTSRAFCIARAGKVFTEAEVDSWEKKHWKGKKPGNVWHNRGGYGCRHHFRAVKPEWIERGYIKPLSYFDENPDAYGDALKTDILGEIAGLESFQKRSAEKAKKAYYASLKGMKKADIIAAQAGVKDWKKLSWSEKAEVIRKKKLSLADSAKAKAREEKALAELEELKISERQYAETVRKEAKKAYYASLKGMKKADIKEIQAATPEWDKLTWAQKAEAITNGKIEKEKSAKRHEKALAELSDLRLAEAQAARKKLEKQERWERTGAKLGTNEGGKYKGPDGKEYYVKFYKDENQAKAELLANDLLGKLNLGAPKTKIEEIDGKTALVTEWLDGAKPAKDFMGKKITDAQKNQIAKQFLGAVLNNNWDVIGFDYENLVRIKNKWHVIDSGGSFDFKATGGSKPFGEIADAFENMLAPGRKAGKFFNPVLKDTIFKDGEDFAKWLEKLTDKKIRNSVEKAGLPPLYVDTIAARRDDIILRLRAATRTETPRKSHARKHLGRKAGKTETVSLILEDSKSAGKVMEVPDAAQVARDIRDFTGNAWYKRMRHSAMGRIEDAAAKAKVDRVEDYLDVCARFPVEELKGGLRRGMAMKRKTFEAMETGEIFDPQTIASWSTQPSTAKNFAGSPSTGVIMIAKTPDAGMYATTIQHCSKFYGEAEVLMSGRQTWRITKKYTGSDGFLYVEVEPDIVKPLSDVKG